MGERVPIDWAALVLAMRKHYGPLERLSRALGKHKGWAAQLARGEVAEPGFSDGHALLDLAYDRLPLVEFVRCRLPTTTTTTRGSVHDRPHRPLDP